MLAAFILSAAIGTDAWLADFRQILDEMSSHYANLDSAIQDRRFQRASKVARVLDSVIK